MLAVDDADETNGCLEVVNGMHGALLPVDDVGCILGDVVAALTGEPAAVRAGQALWFHSFTPHRNGSTTSSTDRRAVYPTYNALAEGDLRDGYGREKLDRMRRTSVGCGVQVSLIGDFHGRTVS